MDGRGRARIMGRSDHRRSIAHGDRPGRVLSLTIRDEPVLYAAYMPFVHNGGLFVPTTDDYDLGDEVFCCSDSWTNRSEYR